MSNVQNESKFKISEWSLFVYSLNNCALFSSSTFKNFNSFIV